MHGSRFLWAHARFFAVLSFVPFIATLTTLVALRLADGAISLFWLPIVQFPSSFVIGLEIALILRFLVLHEYPIIEEDADRRARNRSISQSAMIYAIVTYLVTGAYAGLVKLRTFLIASPETAGPYAPLALVILVLMAWAMRWFWLHVPVALDWPVKSFYERIGRWGGSLRVLALFILCSLVMNVFAGFTRSLIASIGGETPSGFITALDDGVVAIATLLLALLFTCTTAAAVKIMAGTKIKDLEV